MKSVQRALSTAVVVSETGIAGGVLIIAVKLTEYGIRRSTTPGPIRRPWRVIPFGRTEKDPSYPSRRPACPLPRTGDQVDAIFPLSGETMRR